MNGQDLETPKTFPLRAPIQAGDREITEITLQEPTAGELEQLERDQAKDGAVGAIVKLIAKQAKLAPLDVRKIGARDFNAMQEFIGSFLSSPKESSES